MLLQNILYIDVALLLEIEIPCAGATVHKVGKSYQVVIFDDEWIAFCSATLRKNILKVFPFHIELGDSAAYRHIITDFYPSAFTVFFSVPLIQILVLLNQPHFIKRRYGEIDLNAINI